MKDIPVFSCPDGIATLILREVPFRGEGYILVRGVFGTLEGLLAECAGFCRAAGAERLFAAGRSGFFRLSGRPSAFSGAARRGSRCCRAGGGAPCSRHGGNGSGLGAGIQCALPGRARSGELQPAEERALAAGGEALWIEDGAVRIGLGRVRGSELLAVAALLPGRGRMLRAGAGGPVRRAGSAPDVRRGEYARHAAV